MSITNRLIIKNCSFSIHGKYALLSIYFQSILTPTKQIMTLNGNKKKYLMKKPHIHIMVSFQEINSYPLFVRISRFQFFSSSVSKRDVTWSSMIASTATFTQSNTADKSKSLYFSYKHYQNSSVHYIFCFIISLITIKKFITM